MNSETKFLDKNDKPCPPPMFVESFEDALKWYASVYNSKGDGGIAPTLGVPQDVLGDGVMCLLLSAASEAAGKRTKEELLAIRNHYDFEFNGVNFLEFSNENVGHLMPPELRINKN